MNKTLKWILIGLAIAVGAFLIAMPLFTLGMAGGRLGFHRTSWMMPGMMLPFGGLFMFLRFLVPLGVIALAVVGVVLLVRNNKARQLPTATPPAAARVCVKCGNTLHAEGEFCPFCGEKQP